MAFVRSVWPTVIELPGFLRDVDGVLSEVECHALGTYLAKQPMCGDLIPGGKGLRKVRWKSGGKGKRGGARIIYFYWTPDEEIFLLAAYAKSEQVDLGAEQKRELVAIVDAITRQKERRS
jgi:hypothetical protein